jgi:AAA+ superfamily predicted ATPase
MDILTDLFKLDEDDLKLICYLFLCRSYDALRRLVSDDISAEDFIGRGKLAIVLGMTKVRLNDILAKLEKLGLIEVRPRNISFASEDIFRLWDIPQGMNPEELFCSPFQGETLPLDDFPVNKEEITYLLELLKSGWVAESEKALHILLYGPPGTGKSTFAHSVASALGVKALAVSPKNSKDSGMERRLSLNVCITRAASRKDALVVVDEAENILTDRFFPFSKGESVDKSWINELLEQPGQPMFWIINYPHLIDQSIKRRFSYSLFFQPLGVKERRRLWEGILTRYRAGGTDYGKELEKLVKKHRVPAAVIDRSVKQAKEISGDFWKNVSIGVKAFEELEKDGKKEPLKKDVPKRFTLEGVTAGLEIQPFIERLKAIDNARDSETLSPGFGTMLFYGPPGTGKTALARFLAEELGKELITKRASDIMDCYVGMTEKNIAAAFREAEEEDSVMVIDEADSFLYSRDIARRSWETSFVNEFLLAIEECRFFLICTSNRRDNMDSAAMRRFSFKVPFKYAGPKELKALYLTLLAPVAGNTPDETHIPRVMR